MSEEIQSATEATQRLITKFNELGNPEDQLNVLSNIVQTHIDLYGDESIEIEDLYELFYKVTAPGFLEG